MDKEKMKHFKARLLEEKEKTIESLENIQSRREESEDKTDSQLSTYSNHPADKGTNVYMRSQDRGFIENLEGTLEEIEQSLEDIENGSYGYCDNCEKMISEERLEIMPYAKTCLGCSGEDREGNIGREFESIDDETLGYKRDSSEENMGYGREDVYVDVMEDNIVPNDPSYSTGDNIDIEDKREDLEIIEEIEDMSYKVDETSNKRQVEKKEELEDEDLI